MVQGLPGHGEQTGRRVWVELGATESWKKGDSLRTYGGRALVPEFRLPGRFRHVVKPCEARVFESDMGRAPAPLGAESTTEIL